MPTYEFLCKECKHEFEDFMSIKAPDPEECPECKSKGQIQRLISGGSGKGKVILTGQELIDQVKIETEQMRKDIHSNEKNYANVLGPDRYHKMQTQMDKRRREKF